MDIKVTRQKSDTCKKWNFKVETKLLYENMSIEFHILKNKSVTPVTVIDP